MIRHFFECTVPISKCNLHCEYCYVMQENRRNIITPSLKKATQIWKKAIDMDRIGKSFFSFCGYGETLLAGNDFLKIVYDTLDCGHIVNITNNGTATEAIEYLVKLPIYMQKKLLLSFSLHYDELKKCSLLERFSENIKKVMHSEISCFVQLNLCDSYAIESDEIMKYCLENFGCLPQVATTRRELGTEYSIYTDLPVEKYEEIGKSFKSNLFLYTFNNFNQKRNEFCYAGEFSYKLDISTGDLQRCYFEGPFMNIYENTVCSIPQKPIGKHCCLPYCVNSSHFLALGSIYRFSKESYASLRNRECNWIKNEVKKELSAHFIPNRSINGQQIKELMLHNKVMLYGAGHAARSIIAYLYRIGVDVEMIYVSNKDNNDYIDNIQIVEFNEETKERINGRAMIIAMTNYNNTMMIKSKLSQVKCILLDYYDMFLLDDFC